MSSRFDFFVRVGLLLFDVLLLNGALFAAFYIFESFENMHIQTRVNLLYVVNLLWLLFAAVFKMYDHKTYGRFSHVKNTTINSLFIFTLFFSFYLAFVKQPEITIGFSLYFLLQFIITVCLSRIVLKKIVHHYVRNTTKRKKIAIIGFNETARKLAQYFNDQKTAFEFSGFFDDASIKSQVINEQIEHTNNAFGGGNLNNFVKGPVKDIINYALHNDIKEIYSTLLPDAAGIKSLVQEADQHCLRIKFVPDFSSIINPSYSVNYLNNQLPVISLRSEPLEDIRNQVFKRMFDIFFSLFVIIFILSWLYPIIAIAIKLSSKGPVMFKQLRSGQDNKSFLCYKFRTMKPNSDSDSKQASVNDDRVTTIGKILRKTSMDELPQFFNVLSGDMSVVGPRPHMLSHTAQYSAIISRFMVRHFAKPGITGWAQVNGFRGGTETNDLMEQRVEHDIWYMEHWSLWLDIKIIFRTVWNVFKGEKTAY
ncbi:undecaprenyl-phosphate glucose phosphotransferase [Foetidibacter luteolus]|uniref:undecaprenyl-phosphate glucose phosphotransferase n=1 Tax=Foetidibacter luteolus TaxID=2608880 RepID=UPI00129ADA59|nr:undecaprenyl-phosphate glucose phosphotransferase [Foetidibacter luteolus]